MSDLTNEQAKTFLGGDLPKQLRIKAGMMNMGELIAWGSDTALMEEAANLIEQQQSRIAELSNKLTDLGYCAECNEIPEHHLDEPFSSCSCGTGEDYATRPLQKVKHQQIKIYELSATLERLRDEVKGLNENQTGVINLNAVKREVIESLIESETVVGRLHNGNKRSFIFSQDARSFANQRYPDKEQCDENTYE